MCFGRGGRGAAIIQTWDLPPQTGITFFSKVYKTLAPRSGCHLSKLQQESRIMLLILIPSRDCCFRGCAVVHETVQYAKFQPKIFEQY